MIELINLIEVKVKDAFKACGYDENAGTVSFSNRPDLCEFQCNGAMALAKAEHKNPFEIAESIVSKLAGDEFFSKTEAVRPGFININLSEKALVDYVYKMGEDKSFGVSAEEEKKKIFLDYGGPNVAKPLHIGHLRSAVIGESVKRILKARGHEVISDIHLGDWGQQMGLIINELRNRKPDLVYFDESFSGQYPKESPFTLSELEEIYPFASAKSKEDSDYKEAAMACTHKLQQGHKAYNEILRHILNLSITDLRKSYEKLNVSFDLWKGESDAAPFIEDMVSDLKNQGIVYESDGALVVDVKEDTDKKEVPPCMILKSDGAALYNTTDLGTLVWRMRDYNPDEIIYIVDKRQSLYFTQVFRCSKKAKIVPKECELTFLGFGTMNGSDGTPFKTREGGVMRLSVLLEEVKEECQKKLVDNQNIPEDKKDEVASQIALSAIKYGDLCNAPGKDYIFDIKRFVSFEGNTGPYILYTIVRIKSILRRYMEENPDTKGLIDINLSVLTKEATENNGLKNLLLVMSRYNVALKSAATELSPNRICAYVYELSNAFNGFYHDTKILACDDEELKLCYLKILSISQGILEHAIDLLGFSAPERM